jgi:hypothetical protein
MWLCRVTLNILCGAVPFLVKTVSSGQAMTPENVSGGTTAKGNPGALMYGWLTPPPGRLQSLLNSASLLRIDAFVGLKSFSTRCVPSVHTPISYILEMVGRGKVKFDVLMHGRPESKKLRRASIGSAAESQEALDVCSACITFFETLQRFSSFVSFL